VCAGIRSRTVGENRPAEAHAHPVALDGFWLDRLADRLPGRWRAIILGAAAQAVTFVVMLLGLTYLYVADSSMSSHLRFLDQKWLFTLPWMLVNGAFGGYTAYALVKRA
jgi:hypothetical protein